MRTLILLLLATTASAQVDYVRDSIQSIEYKTRWGKPLIIYKIVDCNSDTCTTFNIEVKRRDKADAIDFIDGELSKLEDQINRDSTYLQEVYQAFLQIVNIYNSTLYKVNKLKWARDELKRVKPTP